jgi:hypothetical protein
MTTQIVTTIEATPGPVAAAISGNMTMPNFKAIMGAAIYPAMSRVLGAAQEANAVESDVYNLLPVDLGTAVGWDLRSSWNKWWTLEYTMPEHGIDAVNAPLLVFFWEKMGRLVKTPHVNHPGHQGNMAIHTAMETAKPEINAAVGAGLRVMITFGDGSSLGGL